MKYSLLVCLLVVGLMACSGGRSRLEDLGKEACRKASSCCQSIRVTRTVTTETDPGNETPAVTPATLVEWNPEMLTW
ncbi:hypothetical protein [Asinibacterium sp. OR53]|uniref:hypothetical protein n=1 Tax=Asinibacterium sp. OR53 TaxID=925409 RepID=UPI0004AD4BF9|nr:hypothetical protein [Asinibacterium sp. OR53]MBN8720653.1 hypothetical protein [Sediminibacterium magnilacihabitans]